MEDGEIHEDASGATYSPALEWQGDAHTDDAAWALPAAGPSSAAYAPSGNTTGRPSLRLLRVLPAAPDALKAAHTILARARTLAIVDGYSQVQVGRDEAPPGTDVPRIRLKEMEVSKLHATVYYDEEKCQWAVVDMGSKHGTYIRGGGAAASTSGTPDARGQRLSGPRVSSMPRVLRHLDELSFGSTTFVAHIHEDSLPCEACASKGSDEIPLFNVPKAAKEQELTKKRKRDALEPLMPPSGNAKTSLNMLKKTMLSRHSALSTLGLDRQAYTDRSARRRAIHPSTPDVPGVPSKPTTSSLPSSRPASPAPEPVSAPPAPLSSTNIGHRLLMKQGWTPGTTLGQDSADAEGGSTALAEPIQVNARTARTGLGVPERASPQLQSQAAPSWKEEGKRRRWADVQPGS
ncbi:FHA and G-patch domain-containing protein [Phanerochaete sordida]|uniref:FHA and G-patch domain-containing protein n=1 Tax=Phanerochaete sordida TaxID=48140 RepID=A0A9P3GKE6_9APHY|nr:FHA and G-patch domain-containing protein [Phanerochaete sordida]